MSKSKGNILYTDTLLGQGYDASEIRFFLIYGHYREKLNYSTQEIRSSVGKLRNLKETVRKIGERTPHSGGPDGGAAQRIKETFAERMDDDLDVRGAFDGLETVLSRLELQKLDGSEMSGILMALREIDGVLNVVF
jgi:cysteinyl-tRNA synthetase